MNQQIVPSKQGQVIKLINPAQDENSTEVYLILEDLRNYDEDTIVSVVSLTDLQRNISNPMLAQERQWRNLS